jgi:ankyrin repeat protein
MKKIILLVTLFLIAGISAADEKPAATVNSAQLENVLVQRAFDGDLEAVQRLVEKGASVESSGPKKRTALIWAAMNGHEPVVAFLHGAGADVNAKDKGGQTALMFAVKGSHVETARYLLENNAEVDARSSKQGMTALIIAAAVGNMDIVQLLLQHGADIELAEKSGATALDRARQFENQAVAELLEGELAARKSN